MSHVDLMETVYPDRQCLEQAAKELGWELRVASKYRWYGRHAGDHALPAGMTADDMGQCDLVLVNPKGNYEQDIAKCDAAKRGGSAHTGHYDVGLIRQPDGTYRAIYDWWGRDCRSGDRGAGVEMALGKDLSKFNQVHNTHLLTKAARANGMDVRVTTMDDGTTQLEVVDSAGGVSTMSGTNYGSM